VGSWVLLTVFAVALAQQPRVRRRLQKEIADYSARAEARVAAERAGAVATSTPTTPGPAQPPPQ
jgi:hypothetical protein